MTNQEAINYLLNPLSLPEGMDIIDKMNWHEEAVDMAIEALKAQELKNSTQEVKNSSDAISRQAAINTARDWYEGLICGSFRGLEKRLLALPSAQPEPQWHECFEDDPNSFPDDDRLVLMSFSNFPTPAVGWFKRDEEGGYWTEGSDRTLVEMGLFVDGWWELPKKPERN